MFRAFVRECEEEQRAEKEKEREEEKRAKRKKQERDQEKCKEVNHTWHYSTLHNTRVNS